MVVLLPQYCVAFFQCSFCGDLFEVKFDSLEEAGTEKGLSNQLREKGWLDVDGKTWCGTCDPRGTPNVDKALALHDKHFHREK